MAARIVPIMAGSRPPRFEQAQSHFRASGLIEFIP
jgi:hypothetical protein